MNKNAENKAAGADSAWMDECFQKSLDSILVQAMDGVILEVNPAAGRLFGLDVAALVGRRVSDFMALDCSKTWAHDLGKLIAGEWRHIESVIVTAAGRHVPVHVNGFEVLYESKCPALVLHFQDHSVYQRLERALLASRDEWEQSFDAISESVCIVDRQWNVLRANIAMNAQFEPQSGDLIGQNVRTLLGLPDEGIGPGNSPNNITQDEPLTLFDRTLPSRPGSFTISAYPLVGAGDVRRGAIIIVRDVTEQMKMREELNLNLLRIQQESKMAAIGRLAGGVAHDFNNLLTSIIGCGTLTLNRLADNDPLRKEVQEIISAGERATALTRQLLDFSHDAPMQTSEANLNAIVDDLDAFLRRMLGDNIVLSIQLDPRLKPVRLNLSRTEQVIMNLAANARDAMTAGGKLTIETCNVSLDENFCRTHAPLAPGEYVLLAVSDTGCGIAKDVLEHVFEPFFTTKEKGKGTGIGLAIVYGIVKQFGGTITCYSEVGKGTTFKMYLPALKMPARVVQNNAVSAPPVPAARGNETLLVVDDEPNIVALIKQMLSEKGYAILPAHSAQAAIDLCRLHDQPIHLAIMDISMPDMSGMDLLLHLRKDRPDIKAMFMSGYGSWAVVKNGLLDSSSSFIQKPFTFDGLTRSVREALDA